MLLRGPVLVGTDFSAAAAEALRQGTELARHLHAQLIVCHVIPELIPDGSPFTEFRRAHLDVEQSLLAKARAAVEAELERVLGSIDGPAAEIVLQSGSPHAGLLSQADATDAGVVVTVPGSVALDVVRHAPGAVLVARPSPRGPVVGATDFSDPSRPAVELAASEARRRGSPLHLLHAFDVGQFALGPAPVAMPYLAGNSAIVLEGLDQLSELAKTRLDEALRDTGLAGEAVVVSGRAAEAIVRYAESVHAELVVVGTHGRSGLARLTLGSTAAAVVESAPCSVLVVRLAGS